MAEALADYAARLAAALRRRGELLATAESCTGGWVAKICTDLAGSSAWFERGFVTYSNDSKQELLGVSTETLDRYGAVSEQTATEMARGARRVLQTGVSLAITGIAGPGGGMPDKPVGLVYIALSAEDEEECRRFVWDGDREQNKARSAQAALEMLADYLRRRGGGLE